MPEHPYAIIRPNDSQPVMMVHNYMTSLWTNVNVGYEVEITFSKSGIVRSYRVIEVKNFLFTKGYMEFILHYMKGCTVRNI